MTSDLALHAARAALADAGMTSADHRPDRAGDLDARQHFPGDRRLGPGRAWHHHGAAFDLQAVCSGFVYALQTADALLARAALPSARCVIGAETFSRILDWNDRTTCVLFGDGAGAVVIEAQEKRRHA